MMYWLFPFLEEFAYQICDFWWQMSQAADKVLPGLGDFIFGIYEHLFA